MLSRRIYISRPAAAAVEGGGLEGQGRQEQEEEGEEPAMPAAPAVRGVWHEPGNFNSSLSALVWTAQLVLFDYACFQQQADERKIPRLLRGLCQKWFQQLAEAPFGHILQWRLYLFEVARGAGGRAPGPVGSGRAGGRVPRYRAYYGASLGAY
jgi:hypothetical protein